MWCLFFVSALQQVDESHQVALHVEVWVFQRVANTRLRCQVDDGPELLPGKQLLHPGKISDVAANKLKSRRLFEDLQARLFEPLVVKAVEIVDSQHFVSRRQEPPADVKPDEACTSGN